MTKTYTPEQLLEQAEYNPTAKMIYPRHLLAAYVDGYVNGTNPIEGQGFLTEFIPEELEKAGAESKEDRLMLARLAIHKQYPLIAKAGHDALEALKANGEGRKEGEKIEDLHKKIDEYAKDGQVQRILDAAEKTVADAYGNGPLGLVMQPDFEAAAVKIMRQKTEAEKAGKPLAAKLSAADILTGASVVARWASSSGRI